MSNEPASAPEGLHFLCQDFGSEEAPSTFTLLSNVLGSPRAAFFILVRLKGNLRALACSAPEELQAIPFVDDVLALRLKSAIMLADRIHEYQPEKTPLSSSFDVYSLCGRSMNSSDREYLRIVLLDIKQSCLGIITAAVGGIHSLPLNPKEIFKPAVAHPACLSIVMVHNHPSGDPQPSPEDVAAVSRMVEAGRILGIRIRDSLIIGHNDYFSFRDEGLIE